MILVTDRPLSGCPFEVRELVTERSMRILTLLSVIMAFDLSDGR